MLCQSNFVSSRRVQPSPDLQYEESPRMECSLCLYGPFYAGCLVVVNKVFSQSFSPFVDEGSRCEYPNVFKRPFLWCSQTTFVLDHLLQWLFITTCSRRQGLNYIPGPVHSRPSSRRLRPSSVCVACGSSVLGKRRGGQLSLQQTLLQGAAILFYHGWR